MCRMTENLIAELELLDHSPAGVYTLINWPDPSRSQPISSSGSSTMQKRNYKRDIPSAQLELCTKKLEICCTLMQ